MAMSQDELQSLQLLLNKKQDSAGEQPPAKKITDTYTSPD